MSELKVFDEGDASRAQVDTLDFETIRRELGAVFKYDPDLFDHVTMERFAQHFQRYVEAALMSPIGPRRLASPFLLGGPHAADFAAVAATWGLSIKAVSVISMRRSHGFSREL